MAHDASHGHAAPHGEPQSKTGLRSAFFLVVVLAGLFIASLNFISAMGGDEGHGAHGGGEAHAIPNEQATSNQTMSGEDGTGKAAEHGQHESGTVQQDDTAASHATHDHQ